MRNQLQRVSLQWNGHVVVCHHPSAAQIEISVGAKSTILSVAVRLMGDVCCRPSYAVLSEVTSVGVAIEYNRVGMKILMTVLRFLLFQRERFFA